MKAPLIVDGGLATGLEALGCELHPRLWSAGVVLERPAEVVRLHRAYLAAGADILISASYQMSFDGLAREGVRHDEATRAMRRTVELARGAVAAAGRPALVAASIGPYGATLADGSEYRGRYALGVRELAAFHRERLEVLSHAGADMLAIETIPSLEEARALAGLLAERDGVEAWISFTCRDGRRLRDGQPVAEAVGLFENCPRIAAVGVNCTAPRHVSDLIDAIRAGSSRRIIVYPNSGELWDAGARRWHGDFAKRDFVSLAEGWAAKGVWAIGGCCRIGPETIRALARRLRGENQRDGAGADSM